MCCCDVVLCEGRGHGESRLEFPGPARPTGTTWLCLECLCLSSVSGFTCAVSVTTTLSLSATRHDIQYDSAGTRPISNLWLSPVGAVLKSGSTFYLETFWTDDVMVNQSSLISNLKGNASLREKWCCNDIYFSSCFVTRYYNAWEEVDNNLPTFSWMICCISLGGESNGNSSACTSMKFSQGLQLL